MRINGRRSGNGRFKEVADRILPFEALFDEAAMSTADAAKKFGSSRASGFEDFRNRLMEQLVVRSEKILGVIA